jgi:hypothetical protein
MAGTAATFVAVVIGVAQNILSTRKYERTLATGAPLLEIEMNGTSSWEVSTLDGAFKWLTSREQAKLLQSPDLRLVPSKRLAPPDSSCLSGQWPPCCALSSYMLTPRNQLPRQTVPSLHSLLRQHRLTSIAFFGDSVGDLYMQGIRYLLRRDAANCTSVSFAQAFPGFFGHPSTQGLRRVQSPVLECDGVRLFQVYQSTHMFLNRTTTRANLTLSADWLRAVVDAAAPDVISFNIGLHVHDPHAYYALLKYAMQLLARFAAVANTTRRRLAIFRDVAAQHFVTKDGNGAYEERSQLTGRAGGVCADSPSTSPGWRNQLLYGLAARPPYNKLVDGRAHVASDTRSVRCASRGLQARLHTLVLCTHVP